MGPSLAQLQSVQQPAELTGRDGQRSCAIRRPGERAAFQPTIEQPEPIVFPVEDLQFVALAVAKHEQRRRERVQAEAFLHKRGQRIDGLAQVGPQAK